jgi:hypothetical protein
MAPALLTRRGWNHPYTTRLPTEKPDEPKVLAFVHEKPEVIPVGKSDIDPELRARLGAFRDKVSTGRLVKFWTATEQLPGLVALSLSKTMKAYPAVGWVRADQIGSAELLAEVNELRKQNEELRRAAQAPRETKPAVKNLAGLDARVKLSGKHKVSSAHSQSAWQVELTWAQLFGLLGPYLFHYPADDYVKGVLGRSLHEEARQTGYDVSLRDQDFQTVKVQLAALGLVDIQYTQSTKGGMGLFWSLTPAGQALIYELRTIKAD